jgi:hypothetical protein
VCGYKLVQSCAGCETTRGNGHSWIFYANEVISHWRRIKEHGSDKKDEAHAITKTELEKAIEAAAVGMGESTTAYREPLIGSRPSHTSTILHSEQRAIDTDNQSEPAVSDRVEDLMMAKCQLTNATGYGYGGEAEGVERGRLMYWDDLPSWESQGHSSGNIGR